MENFYWVEIQYDDDKKMQTFPNSVRLVCKQQGRSESENRTRSFRQVFRC